MKRKHKKILGKVLAMTLAVISMLSIFPAGALSNNIDDILFDPGYYAEHNPDVVKVYGTKPENLKRHYDAYGKREGRAPSALFDPKWYSSQNPDIKAAFGSDWVAVYNHFKNHGIQEGRQGSPTFSVEGYKARYADLRNAFGTDGSRNYLYLKHWREYGKNEGRNASPVSTASSSGTPVSSGTIKYVKTSNPNNKLNMRSGPSTGYSVVASLSYGTQVTVHSTSGSWSKVTANGKTGYVSSQYLTSSKPNGGGTTVKPASGGMGPLLPAGAYYRAASNDWGVNGKKWYGRHDVNGVTTGTPIYCPFEATAYYKQATTSIGGQRKLTSYGNYIDLRCDNGYRIILAHLSRFEGAATPITATAKQSGSTYTYSRGTREVSAGNILGYVGTTGNSSGPHLHIEVYNPSGVRVDPATVFPSLTR